MGQERHPAQEKKNAPANLLDAQERSRVRPHPSAAGEALHPPHPTTSPRRNSVHRAKSPQPRPHIAARPRESLPALQQAPIRRAASRTEIAAAPTLWNNHARRSRLRASLSSPEPTHIRRASRRDDSCFLFPGRASSLVTRAFVRFPASTLRLFARPIQTRSPIGRVLLRMLQLERRRSPFQFPAVALPEPPRPCALRLA